MEISGIVAEGKRLETKLAVGVVSAFAEEALRDFWGFSGCLVNIRAVFLGE